MSNDSKNMALRESLNIDLHGISFMNNVLPMSMSILETNIKVFYDLGKNFC